MRVEALAVVLLVGCGDDGGGDGQESGTTGPSEATSTASDDSTSDETPASTGSVDATDGTTAAMGDTSGDDDDDDDDDGSSDGTSTGESVEMPVGASGAFRQASLDSFTIYDTAAHPDGGVVIAGTLMLPGDNREATLAHIDDAGEVVWARRTNTPTNEQFFSVIVDGTTVYGVGLTRRDGGLGNNNETLISTFELDGTYGGSTIIGDAGSEEHAWDAIALSGGGIAIAGYTDQTGYGDRDGMLLVLDASLQPQWSVGLGGPGRDQLYSVVEDDDGGLLVVGDVGLAGESSNSLIAKYNAGGALVFSAAFGAGGADVMRGVAPLSDGRYLVAGETSSWGAGSADGYVGVFDPSADPMVTISTLGGPGYDVLRELLPLDDGRFVVAGQAGGDGEDVWLARLDPEGGSAAEIFVDWQHVYEAPRNQRMVTGAAAIRADGGIAAAFHDLEAGGADTTNEAGVLYTDSLGGIDSACPEPSTDSFAVQPVDVGMPDTTLDIGNVSLTVTALAPDAEPAVDADLGNSLGLCR